MDYKARIDFTITKANEEIFSEDTSGIKLTKGNFEMKYEGGMEGEGVLGELKSYSKDGTAIVIGLEKINGTLGQKTGSFVLEHRGEFKDGILTSERTVVYGSGTGELEGIRGFAKFQSGQSKDFFFIFNYSLV